jgi:hypothetical protein
MDGTHKISHLSSWIWHQYFSRAPKDFKDIAKTNVWGTFGKTLNIYKYKIMFLWGGNGLFARDLPNLNKQKMIRLCSLVWTWAMSVVDVIDENTVLSNGLSPPAAAPYDVYVRTYV